MAEREVQTNDNYIPSKRLDVPRNSKLERKEEKPEEPERRQLTPVANGVKRKPTLWHRFKGFFVGDTSKDVKTYIRSDVIVPAIKDLLYDVVCGAMGMSLYGEIRRRASRGSPNTGYSRYHNSSKDVRVDRPTNRGRTETSFGEFIVETRGQAEDIIEQLSDLIDEYGSARVSDLEELCNVTGDWVSNDWGWYTLGKAKVRPIREGFLIDVPPPVYLKNK